MIPDCWCVAVGVDFCFRACVRVRVCVRVCRPHTPNQPPPNQDRNAYSYSNRRSDTVLGSLLQL